MPFTFAARRRVRSNCAALHRPAALCLVCDLLLLLVAKGLIVPNTIPCCFAICKAIQARATARVARTIHEWSPGRPVRSGGDEGARTPDLDSAIVALSQLSYIPRQGLS